MVKVPYTVLYSMQGICTWIVKTNVKPVILLLFRLLVNSYHSEPAERGVVTELNTQCALLRI